MSQSKLNSNLKSKIGKENIEKEKRMSRRKLARGPNSSNRPKHHLAGTRWQWAPPDSSCPDYQQTGHARQWQSRAHRADPFTGAPDPPASHVHIAHVHCRAGPARHHLPPLNLELRRHNLTLRNPCWPHDLAGLHTLLSGYASPSIYTGRPPPFLSLSPLVLCVLTDREESRLLRGRLRD
jgi:hypothetical protein